MTKPGRPIIQHGNALRPIVPLLALFLASVSPAQAQEHAADSRPGFWTAVTVGYGSAAHSCTGCGPAPAAMGTTVSLAAGTGLRTRTLAGLSLDTWIREVAGVHEILWSISGIARHYPRRTGGFFVTAGTGLSAYSSWKPYVSGQGWNVQVGTGYELRVWQSLLLCPVVKFSYGHVGSLNLEGESFVTGWRQRILSVGLQLGQRGTGR